MEAIRTRAEQEARRRLAVARVGEGWSPAHTAAFLGVHVESVRKWVRKHKAGGADGLAGTPHPGRKPFLTPEQEAEALGWLTQKPTAFGFRTDLWTAARVAQLIEEKFAVTFHPNYLREWLAKRRHTPQKPVRRAKQRNPAAITSWLRYSTTAASCESVAEASTSHSGWSNRDIMGHHPNIGRRLGFAGRDMVCVHRWRPRREGRFAGARRADRRLMSAGAGCAVYIGRRERTVHTDSTGCTALSRSHRC